MSAAGVRTSTRGFGAAGPPQAAARMAAITDVIADRRIAFTMWSVSLLRSEREIDPVRFLPDRECHARVRCRGVGHLAAAPYPALPRVVDPQGDAFVGRTWSANRHRDVGRDRGRKIFTNAVREVDAVRAAGRIEHHL